MELYIRVLDKEGNLATTNKESEALLTMSLTRNGSDVANLRSDDTDGGMTSTNGNAVHTISRGVVNNKNVARYTLDYTNQRSGTMMDKLVVEAGKLKKNISIDLDTADAGNFVFELSCW